MAESHPDQDDLPRDADGNLIPYQASDDTDHNTSVTDVSRSFDQLSVDSPSTDGGTHGESIHVDINGKDVMVTNANASSEKMRFQVDSTKIHKNQPRNGYHRHQDNFGTSEISQRIEVRPQLRFDSSANSQQRSELRSESRLDPISNTTGSSHRPELPSQTRTSTNGPVNSTTPTDTGPPARYPEYADIVKRKDTFILPQDGNTWKHGPAVQDIDNLSRLGFFYTGRGDLLRCHHCGLGLKDWTREDDPLFVHLKYGASCTYIKQNTNPNLLTIYQRHIDNSDNQSYTVGSTGEDTDDIRHPEYQSYEVRLASYTNWPTERRQTPAQLAQAGFFHTGLRDVVRCFACDGGLQSWDSGDEPWIEHARWFSHCPHVHRVKGPEFIQAVLAAGDGDVEDFEQEEAASEMVYPMFSQVAKYVIQMGYSRAAVAMAIEECKQRNIAITQEAITNVLLDKQEQGEILPEDTVPTGSPTIPEFNEKTREGLEQEREYYRNRISCITCYDRDCNILFLPCGHHKMCEICAKDVDVCPLCSVKILQKVKTFMS